MNTATATLKVGDVVKFSRPVNEAEAALRFDLIEHNGNRVIIRLHCDWKIPPTELVAVTEIEKA